MELPNEALVNYIFPNNAVIWWELPIVVYPFMTGLIAGAFVVSALYHVLKIEEFKPLANFALIAAFSFGLFAATPLLFHLGQPQRAYQIYLTPHLTSAMSIFGYVFSGYLLLLTIEIWLIYRPHFIWMANRTAGFQRMIWTALTLGVTTYNPDSAKYDHRITAILAGVGIPWAFILHGYVGFVFGSVKAISWWATALQPIIFLSSAIVSGIAILILMYGVIMWWSQRPFDFDMIKKLAAILWAAFLIDWALEILELIHVSYQNAHEWTVIKPLILGPLRESYIYGQIITLSLVPTVLMGIAVLWSGMNKKLAAYTINFASLLLLLQVLFMRFNVVIGGQLISKSERGFVDFEWELFGMEGVLVVLAIFIAPFIVYYIISRFIPIFDEPAIHADPGKDS
jgi:Ni/Fe-hydrogenase subunit HybB-like protein